MNTKFFQKIYSVLTLLLAIFSVVLTFLDITNKIDLSQNPLDIIDNAILIFFIIDYFSRLFLSKNKRDFFKSNICDLIAIIPFNAIFSFFRLMRIFRVLKVTRILKFSRGFRSLGFLLVIGRKIKRFLNTNGFIYMIYCAMALILTSSVIMMKTENKTFGESLWWSVVTCTTVGYGDISPESTVGRIMAVLLMIFGIGLIGMLTGTITTFFMNENKENNKIPEKENAKSEEILEIVNDLSAEEKERLLEFLKVIKKK